MAQQIRIKDIAQKAGVSVGTVDRVLHNRPNVSKKALEKVKKVLEEMDYQPNMYASALAHNRSYTFYFIMPKHASEAYWQEIEEGAFKARNARRDFQIEVKIIYYICQSLQQLPEQQSRRRNHRTGSTRRHATIHQPTTRKKHTVHTPRFIHAGAETPLLLRTRLAVKWILRCKNAHAACSERTGNHAHENDQRRKGGEPATRQPRSRIPALHEGPSSECHYTRIMPAARRRQGDV